MFHVKFKNLYFRIGALGALVLPMAGQNQAVAGTSSVLQGTIRSWGNDQMAAVMHYWETAFRERHPAVHFVDNLFGPASAMAGIYTGVADLSLMGHELQTDESMGFEWVHQYKALGVEVATGSLDKHSSGAALVVFVHKDNPISRLSLAQLDAIFGSEHRRGKRNIRKWGELGLTGGWADRLIHTYGYSSGTEGGAFFRQRVLDNSYKWNCDVKEFDNGQQDDGKLIDAGQQILGALQHDPYGIAFSKLMYANQSVKPLALGDADSGPYFTPSPENVTSRTYPLTRTVMVFLNRPPGRAVAPTLKAFLEYVLSADGQRDVEREGGYFPMSAEMTQTQLEKIQ